MRDFSHTDANTKKLRATLAEYSNAKASICELDLASLSSVHDFASTITTEIVDGRLPPLTSIICSAYYWNLVCGAEVTEDGYEKSFQVTHLSYVALVLRLVGKFPSDGGREVFLSSDAHRPGKKGLEKYPPAIPDDLELLIKPTQDGSVDSFEHGFQRYAVSKLALVMWMYALNRCYPIRFC